jgi:UDP-N-acetylglucosamine transferase subunit ALG13
LTGIRNINGYTQKKAKILLAPLDWGLGHATRCIPIVKELLRLDCEVIIAATGDQKALLEQEFPFLSFADMPGYQVKYGKNRALTLLKIVAKIPKILMRIKAEKAWLRAFQQREKLDAVISDNRYGMIHKGLFSVFVTHQLLIRTPFGPRADRILQWMQYRRLKRFSICWVPDLPGINSLAGELSHPRHLPSIPIRYIGPLSRFEKIQSDGYNGQTSANKSCDLLILLSGPEPQRTIFEMIILRQRASFPAKTILVRGLPGNRSNDPGSNDPRSEAFPAMTVYDHLPAETLNKIVCGAGLILCRSGYSSIMDLIKLQKKCIFVPTPGQTEQEYLGDYLAGRHLAICTSQSGFSLAASLRTAEDFPFKLPDLDMNGDELLRAAIVEWVRSL